MNKYKLEIKNITNGEKSYIYICAASEIDALYEATNSLSKKNLKYTKYKVSGISLIESNCAPISNYDTIVSNNIKEDTQVIFFNVNWNDYVDEILKLAAPEVWSNDTYPNNGMLVNYMVHTFKKLKSEKNIIITKEYGLFNTGLFTQYYEPIYAYSNNPKSILFVTEYDLGKLGIEKYPERANYFDNPDLLLFDWHYKINIFYKHILEDNKSRINIPNDILESQNLLNTFNGAIDNMKKRVSANYKLAVPQYFEDKVQLLLPLCLHSDNVPDIALVVTKVGNVYQGHTCLTLDMAYNNARLITKPESNWLNANYVIK